MGEVCEFMVYFVIEELNILIVSEIYYYSKWMSSSKTN
jgi:hypothetical protein